MSSDLRPKCKDHPYEHGPGVCASCLRIRLLALQSSNHFPPPPSPPPPCSFPSSVTHHLLFYSTPQVHSAAKKKKANLLPSFFFPRKQDQQIPPDPYDLYQSQPPRLSSSWISSLLGRSKKPPRAPAVDVDACASIDYTPSPAWRVAAPTPARRSAWFSPLWGRPGRVVAGEVGASSGDAAVRRRRHQGFDGDGVIRPIRSRKLVDLKRMS